MQAAALARGAANTFTFNLGPSRPGKTKGAKGYRAEDSVASRVEEQGSLIHYSGLLWPTLTTVQLPEQQTLCSTPRCPGRTLARVGNPGIDHFTNFQNEQFTKLP